MAEMEVGFAFIFALILIMSFARTSYLIDQLESLSTEISKPRSKSFIVATWYRPPNSPFELFSDFESFVGKLDAEGKEYYIMGDLNCNILLSSLNNVNTQALLSITDVYNLKQLVNEPTRVTMNVVPRSTGNTNSGTRELALKCKFKCYINP